MSRNHKPTTIGTVIFFWAVAVAFVIFDIAVLLPNEALTWWQLAITVILIISAIYTTIKYRKEQTNVIGDDNNNE